MERETFLITDIHGCIAELQDLLDKIKFDPSKIRLLVGGDLINRGSDSKAVVKLLRSLGAECIKGNHEEKSLTYVRGEFQSKLTGKKNDVQISSHKISVINSLNDDDIIWLDSLPLKINIAKDWWMIHAGLESIFPFLCQSNETLLRCRFVDKKGRVVKTRTQLPGTEHWSKAWDQPYSIIAGHHVMDKPEIIKNKNNTVILLDTGCVFGNALSGFFFERKEFVSVKARKVYWKSSEK